MDLIGQLSQQLGIDPNQAQALAGGLLGGLESQVTDKLGGEEAGQMRAAIPELSDWKAQAAKALSGDAPDAGDLVGALGGLLGGGGSNSGGLGDLASVAAGMLGGGDASSGGLDIAFVAGLLGKLNLNPTVAAAVAPMLAQFLKDRLPEGLSDKLAMLAPFLGGGAGGANAGLGGLLGGLLGDK